MISEIPGKKHQTGSLLELIHFFLRHMYDYDYVGIVDLDEIFMPKQETTLDTLLARLEGKHPEADFFQFREAFFYPGLSDFSQVRSGSY